MRRAFNRAFSPHAIHDRISQGLAPGYLQSAPLALSTSNAMALQPPSWACYANAFTASRSSVITSPCTTNSVPQYPWYPACITAGTILP
jgi:hypothetical protein